MNTLINFIKASKAEMAHVSWLTRRQTIGYTAIVIVISLIVAAYIAVLDSGFGAVIQDFIL